MSDATAAPGVRAAVALTMGVLAASADAAALARKVYVLNAIEGDRLEILPERGSAYRVFVAGIEAPPKHSEAGRASKSALTAVAFARWGTATCQSAPPLPPKNPREKPRPGSKYCRVEVDGTDMGLAQLSAGQARYTEQRALGLDAQQRERYTAAQAKAKAAKVGMWK